MFSVIYRRSKMPFVESSRRRKRKVEKDALSSETSSKPHKVTLLSPSLLLLEIPADTNCSLPVWDAMRSQQVDVAWTSNPYSVSVHLTPLTSAQGKTTAPSESESESSEATSYSLVQPHMVIQSIGQQHSATQNTSCIVLTFPQNSTQTQPSHSGQTQMTPAIQNTSLIVPLPLIITQLPVTQPSTPTKEEVKPAVHTPTATPTKPKVPSDVPVPSPFHTKFCGCTLICDNFLLNLCRAGKTCKMHHTPYPFHWQLWAVSAHQWIDLPARSQLLMERSYCDVNQESISALLLNSMSKKEPEFSFNIGAQQYKVDFTTMTQTNVTTGFQRDVRCRPVYRSPESMRPYLQTGIQTEPSEFTSWYPPVWSLVVGQDYSLVDVPMGSQVYQTVQNLFYESLPESKVDVIQIQQVQNQLHWDKYQRHKVYMQKHHAKQKEPLERHLFHGTTGDAAEEICHDNFDPRVAGVNGASYGYGSYFATSASFSNTFSAKVGPSEVRHMFLAKVLVGKVSIGRNNYRRPPPLSSKAKQYCRYDTCVDNMDHPTMFVVFDSCQCYPYYLIKYKELPREIDIC
uniref:Poly [ADP-ribose] polymerase n=1 Tax=Labrus bergylta TaxID=56723 RepID=A0A3Q3NIU7_9LABR